MTSASAARKAAESARQQQTKIEERLSRIKHLAWASDQLFVHLFNTRQNNGRLCECVWGLCELMGEQAELAESEFEAFARTAKAA